MRAAARTSSSRRAGLAERDVLADRAVEQEVVLHHDAEVRAIVAQPDVAMSRPSTSTRPLFGWLNAMTRPMSVLLPAAARADERRRRSRPARRTTRRLSTGDARHVLEVTSWNSTSAVDVAHRLLRRVGLILGRHLADLANAIEAGERLAHLRADRRDLHERQRHEADEEDVHHEVAERHRAGEDRAAADDDHQHADQPDDAPPCRRRRPTCR